MSSCFPTIRFLELFLRIEFAEIEAGLIQRVDALNAFLRDIYTEKRIVADGVIPGRLRFFVKRLPAGV